MDLESLYQEIILDHYKHPRGKGLREPFEVEVHHVNPTCGDEITLRVLKVCVPRRASRSAGFSIGFPISGPSAALAATDQLTTRLFQ